MKYRLLAATGYVLAATGALVVHVDAAAPAVAAPAPPAQRNADLDRLILLHRGVTAAAHPGEAYRLVPAKPASAAR